MTAPASRFKTRRVSPEGEQEKRCSRCEEWWPADGEFFFWSKANGLHSWCKACYMEDRAARLAAKRGEAAGARGG